MNFKNQLSKIILPVNISYLPAILAYSSKIAENHKFSEKDISKINLAIEEAVSNVIEHAFLPQEEAEFEIHFLEASMKLQISVLDKGVPFEPEKVANFDVKTDLEGAGKKGLGFLLMKKSVDDVVFINRGFGGKEVQIIKYYHQKHIEDYLETSELVSYGPDKEMSKSKPDKIDYSIYLLKPEQAIEISQCAYRTYGYSYICEHIYYPERIIELNNNGQLFSAVAVTDKTNEVMAHAALELFDETNVPELGMAFTKPQFRCQGCFKLLTEFLMRTAIKKNIPGVFALGVTTHPYSQKAILKNEFYDTGILIGLSPVKSFKGMKTQGQQRESVVILYKNLIPNRNIEIYLPSKHKDIITKIYDNIKLLVKVKNSKNFSDNMNNVSSKNRLNSNESEFTNEELKNQVTENNFTNETEIKTTINTFKMTAKIYVNTIGKDLYSVLKKTVKELCFKKIETVNLYIDLCDELTPVVIDDIEKTGFFFAGILPSEKKQYLILQFLNNVLIDYSKIITVTKFGFDLLQYIKNQDPNLQL